ncbi:MAG TPA: alpha/beta fold hydrolase [Terriglobia bacterium]|nr:alpha/beta fold hydrolase [Terriglobia bacterium]
MPDTHSSVPEPGLQAGIAISSDGEEPDIVRAEIADRLIHAWQGRFTFSISPAALTLAFFDWGIHLANSPGKQAALMEKATRKWVRLMTFLARSAAYQETPNCIEPLPQDHRFRDEVWQMPPFRGIYQAFLLQQQWWHNATTDNRGVAPRHERIVSFAVRQMLDVFSPSNFPFSNPDVLHQTFSEAGANLWRGAQFWVEDWERSVAGRKPIGADAIEVGKDVAVTPGKVVYRNDLIELIQYQPTTERVQAEPVLIVPAWIMKYYILDLSPENSLVRYLVAKGFTVFMISWRNPTAEQRDIGMEDYRQLGVEEALNAIEAICPKQQVHACGYCLGGTLLSIAAATLARDNGDRLKTLTLFAAETDFTEAGELTLFLDESQVAYLEDTMWEQGYLDTRQMSGAFQLLRSNDLIWSQGIRQYLKGERLPMSDLMAWNADATRMPYRMHSEYLRHLFIENELAEGQYRVKGRPIALNDIRCPIFTVATKTDHVAPWQSVYKIHLLTNVPVTFLLTSGGHNAGIVSEPGHPGRRYQIALRPADGRYIDPETWEAATPSVEGSWWPAWVDWLSERSSGLVAPPAMGNGEKGYPPLDAAPGHYVLAP